MNNFLAELAADVEAGLNLLFKEEAGYQAQKTDSGNFCNGQLVGTKYGITPAAYSKFYKTGCPTPDTIKNLTKAQATPIYKQDFLDKIRYSQIANDSVAKLMLFVIVNSGAGMVSDLKKIANLTAGKKIMAETDTPFTDQEVKLLNALSQDTYFNNLKLSRERFYKDLVSKQPAKGVYLKGWLNRLSEHKYSGKLTANHYTLWFLGGLVLGSGGIFALQARWK